jgi:hypothetical protein
VRTEGGQDARVPRIAGILPAKKPACSTTVRLQTPQPSQKYFKNIFHINKKIVGLAQIKVYDTGTGCEFIQH